MAPEVDVEGVCELLNLLRVNCRQSGAIPIIGRDINASIGEAHAGDDLNTVGGSGFGRCHARGQLLMQWVSKDFFWFFLAPFFCRVSVLDCCTGQSPGNEMTVLLGSLQATKGGVAKSKPCCLRGGWGSAGGSGLTWHVGEDFAAWWEEAIHVVVGGGVLA